MGLLRSEKDMRKIHQCEVSGGGGGGHLLLADHVGAEVDVVGGALLEEAQVVVGPRTQAQQAAKDLHPDIA